MYKGLYLFRRNAQTRLISKMSKGPSVVCIWNTQQLKMPPIVLHRFILCWVLDRCQKQTPHGRHPLYILYTRGNLILLLL